MRWKQPPSVKIYEALGCIADRRVEFVAEDRAVVRSSEGDKKYTVTFDLETNKVKSSDNASKFQGYLGYPILAVLMLKGVLPYDEEVAAALKGINWKQLNTEFKRDYDKTIAHALGITEQRGVESRRVRDLIERVLAELASKAFDR